uniref:cysteine--tRNA ligase n=1 Tax=Hordeum vulgare subsp. vulgare TaxID=112509 RepID=A0A8I6X1Z8_HORVV
MAGAETCSPCRQAPDPASTPPSLVTKARPTPPRRPTHHRHAAAVDHPRHAVVLPRPAPSATPMPGYLKYLGYEVDYVRNFTDIDDKIIRRANEAGEMATSLSSRFIDEFLRDMVELQCLPPTREPRVTEHIKQIIDMITKIEEKGKAYIIEGDGVYFSVDNFPEYLSLSGRNLDHNLPGSRVAVDTRKRNPADFALWKSAKEGEPFWESPWGRGRPGWHIECSAMSGHYLGHAFDIHGGGKDLIFPHHENELAQSRAANPESEVKCWMHNGFVNNNGQKMAKSEKKLLHYQRCYCSVPSHGSKAIPDADKLQTLHDSEEVISSYRDYELDVPVPAGDLKVVEDNHDSFLRHMSNDLHTTGALDELMKPVRAMNNNLSDLKKLQQKLEQQKKKEPEKKQQQQQKKKQPEDKQQEHHVQALVALRGEITNKLSILGLMPSSSLGEVVKQLKEKALKRAGMSEEELQQVIEQRSAARKRKDFGESDRIRTELSARGIALMDEPAGTLWKPSEPELVETSHSGE